jgi:uncharacterized protein (TIGR03435 family)
LTSAVAPQALESIEVATASHFTTLVTTAVSVTACGHKTWAEAESSTAVFTMKHAKVSTLADLLSKILFQPVVDQTGLTGFYDISVNVPKYLPQAGGDGIPDILEIINAGFQEELGLKLETKKFVLEYLVVDRIEKTPSGN